MEVITNNIENEIQSNYPFKLDEWQMKSMKANINKENVLVTAHTGSGKTLVAEFGILESIKSGKKIIYTSPIKSLSNQKFHEFTKKFPQIKVGIMTGDIKFQPDADCIIMTTEILRNLLYNKNIKVEGQELSVEIDVYNDVDTVVFDEVHYINDNERGKVWEECLILLPPKIKLIMLSATIDKAHNFANWVQNIKGVKTHLLSTTKRVVPLKHTAFIYSNSKKSTDLADNFTNKLITILDENNKFEDDNYKSIYTLAKNFFKNTGKRRINTKHLLNEVSKKLEEKNLLPAIFFTLSRKKCKEYLKCMEKSLNNGEEQVQVDKTIGYLMSKLDDSKTYTQLVDFQESVKYWRKGIAMHHSGLIPVFKEIIEILYSQNLIKILFATETFAVGVNMPTKTAVFTGITKYDNNGGFRYLRAHEYKQMAGRAGRRGLDSFGTVMHLFNMYRDLPREHEMVSMTCGKAQEIISKFSMNYQFVLKVILTGQNRIMKFIKTSLYHKELIGYITTLQEKLDKFELIEPYFAIEKDILEEYYIITHPDPYFKLTNKARKKNKKRQTEIEKMKNINSQSKMYEEYRKKSNEKNKLIEDLEYYNKMVELELRQVIQYLTDNGYMINTSDNIKIDDLSADNVTIKGIIASQMNECNSLVFTEILTQDLLDNLDIADIAAILSLFTDTKLNGEQDVSTALVLSVSQEAKSVIDKIDKIASDLCLKEQKMKIRLGTNWHLSLNMAETTYQWVSGTSLNDLDLKTFEGNFIKDMIKVSNIAQSLETITDILGKTELQSKVQQIPGLIMRDIVTIDSLYIKN